MRLTTLSIAALALATTACSQGQTKAPDSVGGLEKAQVEAIVKEYLMREPVILAEAFMELERQQNEEQVAQAEGMWTKLVAEKDDPFIGRADAPITIVEFSDYDCGVCKAAMPWVMSQVDDKRRDVKLIVKESAWRGEGSELAARAAIAAHRQGKYSEMHVALMKTPSSAYTPAGLETVATKVGLDVARWKTDMQDPAIKERVAKSLEEFHAAGVKGTPAFLINGVFVSGYGEDQLNSLMEATRSKLKT